jgi:hypothetical protein
MSNLTIHEFQLLPCPFCGSKATLEAIPAGVDDTRWSVGCCDNDAKTECMGYQSLTSFNRRSEAANAWNTREGKLVILIEEKPT